ncbi:hypothetical protein F7725_023091 [Dissostichus mawsoni]|uniref:Unique cartilage matrix-associated protein n=1 Tax=Dissostichus mawsoni TaxID=36200 RepID=A0A7J5Z044_DISMA|nr:hypothetical protein F7725_023091 [Dissostichus mawsoni]
MCATLTRNDERCSDRSPRPPSFFSGRMPSFPPSVKKKNLLCGFGVVEATFRSLMSPISSGLWRLAACLFSSLLKFHSRYKIGSAVLGFFDHGSCVLCLLTLPHRRVIEVSAGNRAPYCRSEERQRGPETVGPQRLLLYQMLRSLPPSLQQSIFLQAPSPLLKNPPLIVCLQRPTLQLCPAAKAALKSHKVRRCTSSSSPLFISLCCELNLLLLPTAGSMKKIFMKEADAATFFRKRSRRASKSQDEINAEQRQILAADERMREFNEEKRTRHENFAEEEDDGRSEEAERPAHSSTNILHIFPEQDERSRESTEQWREFHYDGMHPPREYNRQSI